MSNAPEGLERQPGKSATEIRNAYDEEEAQDWEELHWLEHRIERRTRRRQFGDVEGRVLDVACGTGANFRYLPDTADIVGIDISRDMLTSARKEATKLGHQAELEQVDAERLSFETDSFDFVISSLSTCTFPDPIAALDEMGRVCKPTGEIRLLEHHKWQVEPFGTLTEWKSEGEYERVGCRLYDDPTNVVEESTLEVVDSYRWRFPPFTGVVARPPDA